VIVLRERQYNNEEQHTKKIIQDDKIKNHDNTKHDSIDKELFINLIDRIIFQKWYVEITLIINAEFQITTIALLDSGADMNCIQEGLIPTKYYEKKLKNYINLVELD
jgi:uncharacterized circularly permuted ATP-grasp superfamily protein